ncbi:MAG: DNA primase [Erysipelotrichales bacterium]|nr:DNA primase [Erysipelotrichales bacterium]MBQ5542653.1 DNA primase [Erysipelotrichales bacterium]
MARIPREDIEKIRSKARIEDVIAHYIPVERSGKSYKAVCPFHDDHDPSMMISADKQLFKCFVCGTSGNVFGFVEQFKKISFPAAVREVASMIGYDLPDDVYEEKRETEDPKTRRLHDLLETVISYSEYELSIPENAEIRKYVLDRGITENQIRETRIGYLPDRNLHVFLSRKGYTDAEIVDSGMAIMRANGLSDLFVSRLTIPIFDENGKPVGFTARTMINDERKYINTADTVLYDKSKILYNYHRAKDSIRKVGYAVLTEGPMDALALERAGFRNVVASLGTSCTRDQLSLLKKVTNTVLICYDGDRPGQAANFKIGELAQSLGFTVRIANNSTGLDPDEIEKKYGTAKNRETIEKALGFLDFAEVYLRSNYNLDSFDGKKKYAQRMIQLILKSQDAYERDYFYKKLSESTGLSIKLLEDFSKGVQIEAPIREKKVYRSSVRERLDLLPQYEILNQMMKSSEAVTLFEKELGYLTDDSCQQLQLYISEYYRTHTQMYLADLLSMIPEEPLRKVLQELDGWELLASEYSERILTDSMDRIKGLNAQQKKEILREKIKYVSGPELAKLLKEYEELEKATRKRGIDNG